ncbi:MAG: tryptophan synthase subunit alpha [Burkholderiales bacterium]|nr:tryptophan synthase subunit alpha [Burkholderiales bacterium]
MSRIAARFAELARAGRKALVAYLTAGDPAPALTVPLLGALAEAGADVLELGVPFSDPMADGPVIQRAAQRALAHGVGLAQVLDMARAFRAADARTPLVLMSYANPIEAMGAGRFVREAAAAGADGVIVVDCPPEECAEFAAQARAHGLDTIFLLAPTSTEARIRAVAQAASGYVYYVSLKGVTGAEHLDVADVAAHLPRVRAATPLPICVGFGIRDAAAARRVAELADGVVIGSRIVQEIEAAGPREATARVKAFLAPVRRALDELSRQGAA